MSANDPVRFQPRHGRPLFFDWGVREVGARTLHYGQALAEYEEALKYDPNAYQVHYTSLR